MRRSLFFVCLLLGSLLATARAEPPPASTIQDAPDGSDAPAISGVEVSPIPVNRSYYNWRFVIGGAHFGHQAAYKGTTKQIGLVDATSDGWVAGSTGCTVGLNVSEWTDHRIVIEQYTGAYDGGLYVAHSGDVVQVHIINPTTATRSSDFDVTLKLSGSTGDTASPAADAGVGNGTDDHPPAFDVSKYRKRLLADIDRKVAPVAQLFNNIPPDRRASSSTGETLDRLKKERADIVTASDTSFGIRHDSEVQAAKADAQASKPADAPGSDGRFNRELTYDLNKPGPQTKFPDWNGPWKTCPLCQGTGHSFSSAQQTNQDASAIMAQVAGTGMGARISQAQSYCEYCGGTGQVPDR